MKEYRDMEVGELNDELEGRLSQYRKNVVHQFLHAKKKLKNPISKYGQPLKESTLKTYRNYVKNIRTERDRYASMFFKDIIEAIKMRQHRKDPVYNLGDIEISDLMKKTHEILKSNSRYLYSFSLNIKSYHEAFLDEKKVISLGLLKNNSIRTEKPSMVISFSNYRMQRKKSG